MRGMPPSGTPTMNDSIIVQDPPKSPEREHATPEASNMEIENLLAITDEMQESAKTIVEVPPSSSNIALLSTVNSVDCNPSTIGNHFP